ncbi:MAG: hypothetical protein ABI867_10850 [Kofleriaceae bacterium]
MSRYLVCSLLVASPAIAQSQPAEPEPEAATAEPEIDLDAKTLELESKINDLETRLQTSESSRKSRFPIKIGGYGDVGFFATQGDGSGTRRDVAHAMFPEHQDIGWVFYGDLLATQVNSRGDVADLGELPGVNRQDALNSEGTPTFLVNELNLTVNAGLGSQALFTSSVNFTPRTGTEFALGDSFDVDLAQLEWMPTASGNTSLFVGKVDSVIGIEYKTRKASQRFGITPSLIARYTTGTAVGLKARTKLAGDHIILAAAVTNGSFGTEQFHFFSETDTNTFKTLSGRAALRIPIGSGAFEVGPSGSYGTQDGATDTGGKMAFVGVDAELAISRLDLKAQWLRGKAPGDELTMAYSLDLKSGGYVEADVLVTPMIGIMGRAEFRDAEVQQSTERLYITKNWRATAGLRLIFNPQAVIKAEYSHNGEYGGMPSIPDDVVTTSAVMAF